ncbi:MAG: tyrosine-type recombinase/integrase, partial [Nocardioides sp.]
IDPDAAKDIRSALLNWGYTSRRGTSSEPAAVSAHLAWVARHSRPTACLARPDLARAALEAVATKLDGGRASVATTRLKRANLATALDYAVELGLLETNPIRAIKWTAPRSTAGVDQRVVINPEQALDLLAAVRSVKPSGPRLVAFFACMYYSALRPEEAAELRTRWLQLPDDPAQWGWILLEQAAPEIDQQWTDSRSRRGARALKHRAPGEMRRVPVPPLLAQLLNEHLAAFEADQAGRVFTGIHGAPISGLVYRRVWERARRIALTDEQENSHLARRPYDLRHAAVSTWLNSGVSPMRVAEWAGHSVDVLLKTYAKCIDGRERADLDRVAGTLGI